MASTNKTVVRTVKKWVGGRGFGFITTQEQGDVFCHVSQLSVELRRLADNGQLEGKKVVIDQINPPAQEGQRPSATKVRLASSGTGIPELLLSSMSPTESLEGTENPVLRAGRLVRSSLPRLVQAGTVAVVWDEDIFRAIGRDKGIFCLDGWLSEEAGGAKWGKIFITPEGRWKHIIFPPFGSPFAVSFTRKEVSNLISWLLRALEEMGVEVGELWEEFPWPKTHAERDEESRRWHHQRALEKAQRITRKYPEAKLEVSDHFIQVIGVHNKRIFSAESPWTWPDLGADEELYERHLAELEGTHRPGSLVRLDRETGTRWEPVADWAAEVLERLKVVLAQHWAGSDYEDFELLEAWYGEDPQPCPECGGNLVTVRVYSPTVDSYDEVDQGLFRSQACPKCGYV